MLEGFLEGFDWFLAVQVLGVIVGAFIAGKIVSFILYKIFQKTPFPENIEKSLVKASKYIVFFIGFLVILSILGIDLSTFIVGLGAFSIAIGFATKDIIQNFVSGLIVMGERPFKIGDKIKVKGEEGVVRKIGVRTTILEAEDGSRIILPNSFILSNIIKKAKKK